MNAIAAHRHELERLLKDLSGDIVFSGITFVTSVDAYITRARRKLPRYQRRRQSGPGVHEPEN